MEIMIDPGFCKELLLTLNEWGHAAKKIEEKDWGCRLPHQQTK
jgi:hypothetical protein